MKTFAAITLFNCFFYACSLKFQDIQSDKLPSLKECGQQSASNDAFPWLVYIPLQPRSYNPQADLRCAGTLINNRYVVTAKSCLQFVMTNVQLEHDGTMMEIEIEKKIVEDNCDIVLLKLAKEIVYSDTLQPICLPFEELQRAQVSDTVYSSGWGLKSIQGMDKSERMKLVAHTLLDSDKCQKDAATTCLKVNEDSLSKPCNGDEGSPIMSKDKNQWVMEGVLTSLFDSKNNPCAIDDPSHGPKITENVLKWIVGKIEVN